MPKNIDEITALHFAIQQKIVKIVEVRFIMEPKLLLLFLLHQSIALLTCYHF